MAPPTSSPRAATRCQVIPQVARYVQRRQWHATQQFRAVRGGLEMTMEVYGTVELLNWVLGFGDKAEGASRRRCGRTSPASWYGQRDVMVECSLGSGTPLQARVRCSGLGWAQAQASPRARKCSALDVPHGSSGTAFW